MKLSVSALMLAASLMLTSCAANQGPAESPVRDSTAPTSITATTAPFEATACEEDMPCWDCATMGNRICGPQAPTVAATEK